jgi:TonB family protein
MRYFTSEDNRRLARSALIALAGHAVLLLALAIVVAVNGAPASERAGMITITLDDNVRPAPPGPAAEIKAEKADPPPAPTPAVKPKPDEPKVAATKDAASRSVPARTEANAPDAAKTKKTAAAPEKGGVIRETAKPAKTDTVKADYAPPSQLDQGSLSRLDAALKNAEEPRPSPRAGGGGGGGGGSRASTSWEDNAVRELLSQAAPVIPRWVSEQGLRLKVELSVELNADGLVLVRGVLVSCGYPDVDAAVSRAVSRWKYSRGAGDRAVRGTITYYIELK